MWALRLPDDNCPYLVLICDCIYERMFEEVILSDSLETTLSMFRHYNPNFYALGQAYSHVRRTMRPVDLNDN